jgi:hypothetical protein
MIAISKVRAAGRREDSHGTIEASAHPTRRGRIALGVLVAACAIALLCLRLAASDNSASVLTTSEDPLTTTIPELPATTVPELPQPVEPSTLEDGWYLIVPTKVVTTEDGPLLAQQIAAQAKDLGYRDAKIIRSPGEGGSCDDWGCTDGPGPMGYTVLLKGPYSVPNWTDSDADLDAKYAWHQQLQVEEQTRAGALGLAAKTIGIALFTFADG